jgi:hypothetical protein
MIQQTRLPMLPKTRWLDAGKSKMRNKFHEYLLGNVLPHTTVIPSCECIVYSVYLNCLVL